MIGCLAASFDKAIYTISYQKTTNRNKNILKLVDALQDRVRRGQLTTEQFKTIKALLSINPSERPDISKPLF